MDPNGKVKGMDYIASGCLLLQLLWLLLVHLHFEKLIALGVGFDLTRQLDFSRKPFFFCFKGQQ